MLIGLTFSAIKNSIMTHWHVCTRLYSDAYRLLTNQVVLKPNCPVINDWNSYILIPIEIVILLWRLCNTHPSSLVYQKWRRVSNRLSNCTYVVPDPVMIRGCAFIAFRFDSITSILCYGFRRFRFVFKNILAVRIVRIRRRVLLKIYGIQKQGDAN